MQSDIANVVVLALWGILLLLVILFIYQTFRKNRHAHLLTVGLLFGVAGLTLWAFRPFLSEYLASHTSPLANGLAYVFMYYAIYLHFEQVSDLRPHLARLALMSALVGMGAATSATMLTLDSAPGALTQWNDFAHDAIRMGAFLFGMVISFRGWRMTEERNALVEWLALLILASGGIPAVMGNYFGFKHVIDMSVYELGDMITFVGLVLLIGMYLTHPNYLYRLPVPVYRIIIYNSVGIATYSRAVRTRGMEGMVVPDQLMSMSITAVSSVLSEGLQVNAQLRLIDVTRRVLLFEWSKDISALLICERGTYFARRSLKMLLSSISADLYERLAAEAVNVDSKMMAQLDALVQAAFPYLVFIDEDTSSTNDSGPAAISSPDRT